MKRIIRTTRITRLARLLVAGGMLGTWLSAGAADFECLLEPWQVVEVRSPVDGMIATIAVGRGDAVRRGQVLVRLQSDVETTAVEAARFRAAMEGQLASARNRLDYAQKKLQRTSDLQSSNFLSMQAREEADTEFRLAQSELQSATEAREMARIELRLTGQQLALRTMKSPFNGVVVDRMLNPGDLAESGSGRKPVLRVAQIDPLRADVALPAALFGSVKSGSRAVVTAEVGGARYDAVVRSVDRVIDAASGTFVARLEVPNPRGTAPGGSRCSASLPGISQDHAGNRSRPRAN